MQIFRFLFVALALIGFVKAKAFVVADAEDHQPLGGATLLSANGVILGFSDSDGVFGNSISDFPVSIHCLGYEETKLSASVDTVFMTPKTFELSEVVINPVDRPVLKLNCYIREYTTAAFGNDTVMLFGEYMADYFLAEKKVKGFNPNNRTPYIRVKRQRIRYKNSEGLDSIARPTEDEELISWVSICSVNPKGATLPDSIMNGSTGVVQGKFGEFSTTRLTGNKMIYSRDILADHKDHHWSPWFLKVIGFTIDTTEMLAKDIFLVDENGNYGPNTLQMATYTMEMTVKSKWVKKAFHTKEPIKTYSVIEVYPISSRYLTQPEAKELEWENSQRDITPAPQAPQLPQNIIEMISAEVK